MSTILYSIALILALLGPTSISAQVSTEKVWAVFAYTAYGDSTPALPHHSKTLTQYGAEQLYAAGSAFRNRYVETRLNENTRVQNLSSYTLDSDEVDVLSTTDQFTVASAQAFMQGLYPPVETYTDGYSQLANGSWATYALSGYQFPRLITLGMTDLGFEKLAGHAACPLHELSKREYEGSIEFQQIEEQSASFYARLYDNALSHVFDRSQVHYSNARYISDYLDYESLHNITFFDNLDQEDIDRARWLADQYVYATNSDVSSSSNTPSKNIRSVAGQTLASLVLQLFEQNIADLGSKVKMMLAFGSYEPPVALASLMRLASPREANFYSRPAQGASVVFELFSFDDQISPIYPAISNLYVRFLLHNGTKSSTVFSPHPLFGRGPSNIAISYTEFREEMSRISLGPTRDWCLRCNSSAVFCSGLAPESFFKDQSCAYFNPAIAALIGAVITVIIILLIAIPAFLLSGIRLQRRRKAGLGSFKSSGRVASDQGVASQNSTHETFRMTEITKVSHDQVSSASECSSSWERDQRREDIIAVPGRVQKTHTTFEDEAEEEWRLNSRLKPVGVQENL